MRRTDERIAELEKEILRAEAGIARNILNVRIAQLKLERAKRRMRKLTQLRTELKAKLHKEIINGKA